VERLGDGRYNIVLRGLERFRIVNENHERTYRRAFVEPLAERALPEPERAVVRQQRTKLESLLAPAVTHAGADLRTARGMGDEELVHALAQYLDLEPLEKQALLELACLRSRAEALVELLEMKLLMSRTPGLSAVTH
jgi:hypothetical protein